MIDRLKQHLLLPLLGVAVATLVWQLYLLSVSTVNSEEAPHAKPEPQVAHNIPPQIEQHTTDLAQSRILTDKQLQYLQLVNELRITQVKRLIAQDNEAIALAQQHALKANYSITQSDPVSNKPKASVPAAIPVHATQEDAFKLVYTGEQSGQWNATINIKGRLYDVVKGTKLPTGDTVANIDQDVVILSQGAWKKVLSFYDMTRYYQPPQQETASLASQSAAKPITVDVAKSNSVKPSTVEIAKAPVVPTPASLPVVASKTVKPVVSPVLQTASLKPTIIKSEKTTTVPVVAKTATKVAQPVVAKAPVVQTIASKPAAPALKPLTNTLAKTNIIKPVVAPVAQITKSKAVAAVATKSVRVATHPVEVQKSVPPLLAALPKEEDAPKIPLAATSHSEPKLALFAKVPSSATVANKPVVAKVATISNPTAKIQIVKTANNASEPVAKPVASKPVAKVEVAKVAPVVKPVAKVEVAKVAPAIKPAAPVEMAKTSQAAPKVAVAHVEPVNKLTAKIDVKKVTLLGKELAKTELAKATATPVKPAVVVKPARQYTEVERQLLTQDPHQFTLQVYSADNIGRVQHFMRSNNILGRAKIYTRYTAENHPEYIVVIGHYKTNEDALQALTELPIEMHQFAPEVKSIANIQEDLHMKPSTGAEKAFA